MSRSSRHRGRRPAVHPTPLEREAARIREVKPHVSIARAMREAAEAREMTAAQRKRRLRQEQIIREIDSLRGATRNVTLSRDLYKRVRLEALDRDRMIHVMRQDNILPAGVVARRGAAGVVEQILRDYFYERDEAEREARRKARRKG